jgi:hypothetical protein
MSEEVDGIQSKCIGTVWNTFNVSNRSLASLLTASTLEIVPAFLSDDKKAPAEDVPEVLRKLDLTKGLAKEPQAGAAGPSGVVIRGVNLAFGLESLGAAGGPSAHNNGAAKYRNAINLNRGLESLQGSDSAGPITPTENSAKILELLAASDASGEAWEARVGKVGDGSDSLPDEAALLKALGLEDGGGRGGAAALHEKWEDKAVGTSGEGGSSGNVGASGAGGDTSLSNAASLLGLLGSDSSGDVLEAWEVKRQGQSHT